MVQRIALAFKHHAKVNKLRNNKQPSREQKPLRAATKKGKQSENPQEGDNL